MLQVCTVVGRIADDIVSVRRTADGSIIVRVVRGDFWAEYQRTQKGLMMLESTYPRSEYEQLYVNLSNNLREIDRKSIEMTEAEMRIPYILVCRVEGFVIQVGQSNSLRVFITVERESRRAVLIYEDTRISFVSSSFTKENSKYIRTLVVQNVPRIREVMEQNDMLPSRNREAPHLYDMKSTEMSGMSEVGLRERAKVDRQIGGLFKGLESRGYSNLEIQSMLMESVLETAMQARISGRSAIL